MSNDTLENLLLSLAAAGYTPRISLLTSPSNPSAKYWSASLYSLDPTTNRLARFHCAEGATPGEALKIVAERMAKPDPIRIYTPTPTSTPTPARSSTSLADLGLDL